MNSGNLFEAEVKMQSSILKRESEKVVFVRLGHSSGTNYCGTALSIEFNNSYKKLYKTVRKIQQDFRAEGFENFGILPRSETFILTVECKEKEKVLPIFNAVKGYVLRWECKKLLCFSKDRFSMSKNERDIDHPKIKRADLIKQCEKYYVNIDQASNISNIHAL